MFEEGSWQEKPSPSRFRPPTDTPPTDEARGLLGRTIGGRYRISEILATGGMGVVYGGIQERLRREVAIKVLRTHSSWSEDKSALDRFVREAETAASISHPHGVVVHDFGLLEDGRPYLVMEKLVGQTFEAVRVGGGGQLDPKTVSSLLSPVASALEALHARGIVHRDVKPENLILADTPDGGTVVKVIDFGLVALADKHRLTQKGMIVGTPEYVAPETLIGNDLPDARADVYGLAVVAFELLTGELPFRGATMAIMLAQKLRASPRTLSEAASRPFPVELEAVIAKGLARDPAERYATATELTDALRRVVGTMESERSGTRPSSVPRRRDSSDVWTFNRESIAMDRSALAALVDLPTSPADAPVSVEPSAATASQGTPSAPTNRPSIAITGLWEGVRRAPQPVGPPRLFKKESQISRASDPIEIPVAWWSRSTFFWSSIIVGGTLLVCGVAVVVRFAV